MGEAQPPSGRHHSPLQATTFPSAQELEAFLGGEEYFLICIFFPFEAQKFQPNE